MIFQSDFQKMLHEFCPIENFSQEGGVFNKIMEFSVKTDFLKHAQWGEDKGYLREFITILARSLKGAYDMYEEKFTFAQPYLSFIPGENILKLCVFLKEKAL